MAPSQLQSPSGSSNFSASADNSDDGSTPEAPSLLLPTAVSCSTPVTTGSPATHGERPPVSQPNHRDEKRDNAWYDGYSSDRMMTIKTIRLGLWATKNEMKQLWNAIESEMTKREVLSRDTSRFRGKGTRDALQTERIKAVKAAINGIEHFRSIMGVVNSHRNYKTPLLQALRYHCLQRCYFKKIKSEPPAPAARGRRRKARATSTSAATTTTPRENPTQEPITLENQLPDVALGFQTISVGLNGVEDTVNYLPLHLVPEDKGLRKLNLPSDEMKARLQPEDLSFELLKELVGQDCGIEGQVLVTCPELEGDIVNERSFQLAIYSLVKMGLELKFMFSNCEMVSWLIRGRPCYVCELTNECRRSREYRLRGHSRNLDCLKLRVRDPLVMNVYFSLWLFFIPLQAGK